MRRPGVLVTVVADAEVKCIEALRCRLVDQVLQQQMPDAMAAERIVVGRQDVVEPTGRDEAEMRRGDRAVDGQRRKMTEGAEPLRAHHLAIKMLDAGLRQKIR